VLSTSFVSCGAIVLGASAQRSRRDVSRWGSSVRAQVVTSTTLAALLILSALMVRAAVSVWCGVVAFTESLLS
jgi:hypothetical protein